MKLTLKTKRLILRDLEPTDAEGFAKQGNDKEINFYNWYLPFPLTVEKTRSIIKRRTADFSKTRWIYELAVILKETNEFLGIISLYDIDRPNLKAKLGYWIGKEYRRKGYASEALKEVLRFAFKEVKLNKLSAKSMNDNEKSNALLEKLNFRKIGVRIQDKIIDDKKYDVVEWEILKKDFNK